METVYFEKLGGCKFERQIFDMLCCADNEFLPPISQRMSMEEYFSDISRHGVLVFHDADKAYGFMSVKLDHTCVALADNSFPNAYVCTALVSPECRGKGIMSSMYRELIRIFPKRGLYTRTWHTNSAHIHVLEKMEFSEILRIENDRGGGIDTVYFGRRAEI